MATVIFPARCAVAVICGEHLVSQVYPASVPIEVFIDNAIELLNEDLLRKGYSGLDPDACYELQRANGTRLDTSRTLDDLGIEDGTTLVLAPAGEGESFEPHYEALSSGLAHAGRKLFAPVTAETATRTALVIVGIATLTVTALSAYIRLISESWLPAAVTGVAGLVFAAATASVWRWWPRHRELLVGLGWLTVPLVAAAVAFALPGHVSSAHLFGASLCVAFLSSFMVIASRSSYAFASTVITLSGTGGLISAARMLAPVPPQWLAMCTLVGLLILLTAAPTVALWAARIRPPHFGSITGRDLFSRSDGLPADAVAPVDDDRDDDDEGNDGTPTGTRIADLARRANAVLTGLCLAAAITLPAAVWLTVSPSTSHSTATTMLALAFVLIFISRARAFSDRKQAIALVCGAALAFCAAAARFVVTTASTGMLAVAGPFIIGFGAAGLAAALVVPTTKFTPIVRMSVEWLELAAIIAALPLAAWIGGLFGWVRMR